MSEKILVQGKADQQREAWLDWLRVACIIAIIVLHVVARPLNTYPQSESFNWAFAVILRNASTIAVPLFFMMSGYILLHRPAMSPAMFMKKRMRVIALPFTIWSYFWIGYDKDFTVEALVLRDLYRPFLEPTMFHLWFMYPLIGLYIIMPLLKNFVETLKPENRHYAFMCWLLLGGLGYYVKLVTTQHFAVPLQFFSFWVGFFCAGYFLTSYYAKPLYVWLLVFAIFTAMVFGTFALTDEETLMPTMMYEVPTLHVMLFSCSVFWLCYHYRAIFPQCSVMRYLAERSFFVYLIHPLFIRYIEKNYFLDVSVYPIYYIPLVIAVTCISSFGAAALVRLIRCNKLLG